MISEDDLQYIKEKIMFLEYEVISLRDDFNKLNDNWVSTRDVTNYNNIKLNQVSSDLKLITDQISIIMNDLGLEEENE